jgi:hypothetical protein
MKNFYNDKELLSAYIDGELSQEEKKYIEDKIKSSLELQKVLADLKKLKELTSNSFEKIPDSPFFETRVIASINQSPSILFKLKKWSPVLALLFLTVGLMAILRYSPHLINNLIETQKSNLAGFYKENLQPLLYTADLTNEDLYNFAFYQQLPLDSSRQQLLKLGYDPQGKEFFEIKKVDNPDDIEPANNLNKFVSALKLNANEARQIDSIIGSYTEQLSSLVLVNDKNSVAINPSLWNTRKALLADIITFAQKHAPVDFRKILPVQEVKFDNNLVSKWVDKTKNSKDSQYIFCTPDSIFKENFVFDMNEFRKNINKMEVELKKLNIEQNLEKNFTFHFDTNFDKEENIDKQFRQFKVLIDSDFVKVIVKKSDIPEIDLNEINIPDFDSIAAIIDEATKNIKIYVPPLPPMPDNGKKFNDENKSGKTQKRSKVEINLDSLMNLKNIIADSVYEEQLEKLKKLSESFNKQFNFNPDDSLIIKQNNELKKEMDRLRKELQRFREEMKNYENNGKEQKQDNSIEIRIEGVKAIQT